MKKHDELPTEHDDPLTAFLHKIIKIAVKALAILMVLVIFGGVGDVIYVLYKNLMAPPVILLSITDIFKTFAAFLAVLIAIEIFQNIVMYLSKNRYHSYKVSACNGFDGNCKKSNYYRF